MAQLFEFMGNHTLMVVAFFSLLGMIIYTEYQRIAGGTAPLSPLALTRLMNEDADTLVLDVRGESEFEQGHILNARNFPVNKLDQRLHEIEKFKDRNVVIYCESGMRANRAAARLKREGFGKLHNLVGGMVAWEKANLPVVTS